MAERPGEMTETGGKISLEPRLLLYQKTVLAQKTKAALPPSDLSVGYWSWEIAVLSRTGLK
jgi:hypothetical protein